MGTMNKYNLPTSTEINGVECEFNSDFRDILYIFKILNDPNLLETERLKCALDNFYKTSEYEADIEEAIQRMYDFILMGELDMSNTPNSKPLFDWEQDFNLIIAPINRIAGKDVRGLDYFHWWTFLSAFYEIGESTFNTFVSIRDKLNRNKKLEKYEERIYKENKDRIVLKQKVDDTTQAIMNEILGKGG